MINQPTICEKKCDCHKEFHATRLVVVTGGPGAGKTAVLEMTKKVLCEHVAVLPEAASIVFNGGFWRLPSQSAKLSTQRAIFHTQKEMETLVVNEKKWAVALCDRGTLDGLAYWPNGEEQFWSDVHSSAQEELSRYAAVIHLRTPSATNGYNHQNPLRIETAQEAYEIDKKIEKVWSKHPNYIAVPSTESFISKAQIAIGAIFEQLPECCRNSLKLNK